MDPAILAEGLGKRFHIYPAGRPHTMQEAFLRGFRNLRASTYFWALRDISFGVQPGSITGVVGRNGSGKSTLLRLVGGVERPDAGSVAVNGKIGSLIDLGAGFHPELTGRENLLMSAVISGLTRREAASRLDAIVSFAELEAFIDNPLRTYSTGMQMRLGFSVAIHTDPQILLVDEVLAVGDVAFQQKCLERIDQIKAQGCAILLVSHDMSMVNRLCDEAIWIHSGEMQAKGPAEEVTGLYLAGLREETIKRTPPAQQSQADQESVLRLGENRIGSLEMKITSVRLLDEHYQEVNKIQTGHPLRVELNYQVQERLQSPIFTASVVRADGVVCVDSSTQAAGLYLPDLSGRGKLFLYLDSLALTPGRYSIEVGVFQHEWEYAYDYHSGAYSLEIQGKGGGKGILLIPQSWEFIPAKEPSEPDE